MRPGTARRLPRQPMSQWVVKRLLIGETAVLIAVNVIVRDGGSHLGDCLASVRHLADEVLVHDTGSNDDSVQIARAAGAKVIEGVWEDDFARARNVALDATSAAWVLSLDADERWQGESATLRQILKTVPEGRAFTVEVTNLRHDDEGGHYRHRAARLFRRAGTRWRGRVHEEPIGPALQQWEPLPAEVGAILHLGYADPVVAAGKSARNAVLAQVELDRLLAEGAPDRRLLAGVVLDLGRSLLGAGRRQEAVDAFETVRELSPGSQEWCVATDFLARALLTGGQDEVVLVLADQLRGAGVAADYCKWLAATALAQLGRAGEALPVLREVRELIDAAGREHDVGQVYELRALVAAMVGERREALESLGVAMARFGRVSGRGPLLLELAAGQDVALGSLLAASGDGHLDELVDEFALLGDQGRALSAALSRGALLCTSPNISAGDTPR